MPLAGAGAGAGAAAGASSADAGDDASFLAKDSCRFCGLPAPLLFSADADFGLSNCAAAPPEDAAGEELEEA